MQAIGKYIIVEPEAPKRVSAGGISLPESYSQENENLGTVISIGGDVKDVALKDKILFNKHYALNFTHKDKKLVHIREDDVIVKF